MLRFNQNYKLITQLLMIVCCTSVALHGMLPRKDSYKDKKKRWEAFGAAIARDAAADVGDAAAGAPPAHDRVEPLQEDYTFLDYDSEDVVWSMGATRKEKPPKELRNAIKQELKNILLGTLTEYESLLIKDTTQWEIDAFRRGDGGKSFSMNRELGIIEYYVMQVARAMAPFKGRSITQEQLQQSLDSFYIQHRHKFLPDTLLQALHQLAFSKDIYSSQGANHWALFGGTLVNEQKGFCAEQHRIFMKAMIAQMTLMMNDECWGHDIWARPEEFFRKYTRDFESKKWYYPDGALGDAIMYYAMQHDKPEAEAVQFSREVMRRVLKREPQECVVM